MNQINQTAKRIREAIIQGDSEVAISLLGSDNEVLNMMTPFGTWLHVAAANGNFDVLQWLIDIGQNINACGGITEGSPINEAAAEGHPAIVKYLLSRGALLDISEPEKNPLFSTIHGGHLDIVKLLLEAGIDAKVKYSSESMNDMGALEFAKERGQSEIVEYLEHQ
jgi:uncharacterized protein